MTQEVRVILTLEVDTLLSKSAIEHYFKHVSNVASLTPMTLIKIEVKEEAEIYKNE